MFVDTHCHINIKDYPDNIEKVINQMQGNIIIVSGTNDSSNKEVIKLSNKYPHVFGTIGIHPEEADNYSADDLKFIEQNLINPKIVALGEMGLDYYWRNDNIDRQKDLFTRQIELARDYNKAFVIHSRNAISDTYDILLKEKFIDMRPVLHCYSGSVEMAEKFVSLGAMLGIGGVLTFKNANRIKEVVKKMGIEYLLLETDSPFLTPEPFRGQQNVPHNVTYIAKEISLLKGIPLAEVYKQTTANAVRQFDLKLNL